MASCSNLRSSPSSSLPYLYGLWACAADPPRFYILLLLIFILLTIFRKAGIFSTENMAHPQQDLYKKSARRPAQKTAGFCTEAVPIELRPRMSFTERRASVGQLEQSSKKLSGGIGDAKRPAIDTATVGDAEEDVNRRAEAFIHRVRMSFNAERSYNV